MSDVKVDAGEEAIVVIGRIEVDPDEREAYLEAQRDGIESARAEPGCVRYVVSADTLEDGVVNLFEQWASKAALADHLALLKARPASSGPRVPIKAIAISQHALGPAARVGS